MEIAQHSRDQLLPGKVVRIPSSNYANLAANQYSRETDSQSAGEVTGQPITAQLFACQSRQSDRATKQYLSHRQGVVALSPNINNART